MDTGDPRQGAPRQAAEHDEIDELFEGANPNPERIGCPPDSVLVALAQQRGSPDDPVYDHIQHCSPCYKRLRELRAAAGTRAATGGGRTARWWLAAIAAGVLLVLSVLGALWWRTSDGQPIGPGQGAASRLVAELDLRPYGASRGENGESGAQPLVLRRGIVDLKMILPAGAEPGRYDIQLVDDQLKSRSNATADGVLQDYRTEVRTTLDLSDVPPGHYQLALRYGTQRWRLFPVEVR
jgi:hypothetical protein